MARKPQNKEDLQRKAERITTCLAESGVKPTAVARYCDISLQSVTGWKKTGQIEDTNLFKLSELTGFRYVWLRDGTGDKRYSDSDENHREYLGKSAHPDIHSNLSFTGSAAGDRLVASVRRVLAKDGVDDSSLVHLADFMDCLSGFKRPQKSDASGLEAHDSQNDMEGCLMDLARHISSIQPALRPSVGELLKSLCDQPESHKLIIRSLLATAQVSASPDA
jgi:hypothetical protein